MTSVLNGIIWLDMKTGDAAIGIEHVDTHSDGTIFRTRWFDSKKDAEAARREYVAQGAHAAGAEKNGGCLGAYRTWAHFSAR